MRTHNRIVLAAAVGAVFATGAVFADTASDSVDATAGLEAVMLLSCTDVSFGVWRVPLRNSGGTTTITLDRDANTAVASGNDTLVASSRISGWNHSRGECTLTGSQSAEDTAAGIILTGNTNMAMSGSTATGYTDLAAPTSDATLVANITGPATCTISAEGGCTFYLGGTLIIPEAITAANYGGYKTDTAATVTVNDAP